MASSEKSKARTAKARERSIINLAVDLAEEKLRNGTASSQLICHFLKLATERERLENERIRGDLKLTEAKIKQTEKSINSEELYAKAIEAMRMYSGGGACYEEDL